MKELIGHKIQEIRLDPNDQTHLAFITAEGVLAYMTEGDCCSYSYFAEILGVSKLLDGGPVTAVEVIDDELPEPVAKPNEDVVQVYGFRIRVGEESAIVTFRNNSNGYYGGWCEPVTSMSDKRFASLAPVTTDYRGD